MAEVQKKLYRLPKEGMIAGVASGFARYFVMDVTLVRLLFVGLFLLTQGAAIIAYIVLAFVMPTSDKKETGGNFAERVETLAEEVKSSGRLYNLTSYIGVAIIVIGAWLLAGQFFPQIIQIQWNVIWPLAIIAVGAVIIVRSKNRE